MPIPAQDQSQPAIRELLRNGCATLQGDGARLDCELLLAAVLGRTRSYLFAFPEQRVEAETCAAFAALLERRRCGEPIAYLTGRREFWSLSLEVNASTLVPRPETELLVELALQRLGASQADILDLGTGSGAIALALARERPGWRVFGVDVDAAAIAVARANGRRLGIAGASFATGNWYCALAGRRFELIVSNPPYIRENEPCLCNELRYEPRHALIAGADGLAALRVVVAGATDHLLPGGWLLTEHGAEQGSEVRALFSGSAFDDIATCCDLAGLERVTLGRRALHGDGDRA